MPHALKGESIPSHSGEALEQYQASMKDMQLSQHASGPIDRMRVLMRCCKFWVDVCRQSFFREVIQYSLRGTGRNSKTISVSLGPFLHIRLLSSFALFLLPILSNRQENGAVSSSLSSSWSSSSCSPFLRSCGTWCCLLCHWDTVRLNPPRHHHHHLLLLLLLLLLLSSSSSWPSFILLVRCLWFTYMLFEVIEDGEVTHIRQSGETETKNSGKLTMLKRKEKRGEKESETQRWQIDKKEYQTEQRGREKTGRDQRFLSTEAEARITERRKRKTTEKRHEMDRQTKRKGIERRMRGYMWLSVSLAFWWGTSFWDGVITAFLAGFGCTWKTDPTSWSISPKACWGRMSGPSEKESWLITPWINPVPNYNDVRATTRKRRRKSQKAEEENWWERKRKEVDRQRLKEATNPSSKTRGNEAILGDPDYHLGSVRSTSFPCSSTPASSPFWGCSCCHRENRAEEWERGTPKLTTGTTRRKER